MRLRKTLVVGAAAVVAAGTVAVASALPNLANASESVAADTAPPTAPKSLKSTGSTATSVALSWKAATDNVGVAAYDVYHDGNKYTEVSGKTLKADVTGLKPKTDYRFTVFARDAAGNVSTASNPAAVTTPESSDKAAPSAPKDLAVTGTTSNSVSLKWSAATDNVGVSGYDVYNGGTVLADGVKGTSTEVKNLVPNTSYTFTVKAKDAATNESPASNQVTAKTKAGQGGTSTPSTITTVASGLTVPWGIDWLPDGNALVGERDSFDIYKVTQAGQKTKVGNVPDVVTTNGEGGLLGIAVSPRFASDKLIFVFHTASDGNQIVKMTFDGTRLGTPTPILTKIKKNRFHNGGRLKFGPGRLPLREHRRRPAAEPRAGPQLDQRQDPADDHRRQGRAGQPVRHPRLQRRAPQPAGPRLGLRRPALVRRVRQLQVRRAQPDRARQELRLADVRGQLLHVRHDEPEAAVVGR